MISDLTDFSLDDLMLLLWRQRQGAALSQVGLTPDLLWLTEVVMTALPDTASRTRLAAFVRRHHPTLQAALDDACRAAAPTGHPLDVNPPRAGVLHRSMSLIEAEDAIRNSPGEHVAIFAADGRQVGRYAPRGTRAAGRDPRGLCTIDSRIAAVAHAAGSWLLTHNHPTGGPLSPEDLILATHLNLAGIRAVCPNGWTWWVNRGPLGWPAPFRMAELAENAAADAQHAMEAIGCSTPTPDNPEPTRVWQEQFSDRFQQNLNRYLTPHRLRMYGAPTPDATLPDSYRPAGH